MSLGYLVPAKFGEDFFVEKKSRFIGHVLPASTEEEALAFLVSCRKKYWDASHNVFAYIIKDGPTRFSDDGEPQGTAGKPVLEVLQREKVVNSVCVVTRYFGGTLLGAGGLIRAYAKGAKLGLDAAGIVEMQPVLSATLACSYSLLGPIQDFLKPLAVIEGTEYAENVTLALLLRPDARDEIERGLMDLSSGRLKLEVTGESFRGGFTL